MTKQVKIDIIARDKTKAAIAQSRKSLDGLKSSVFNLRNAFLGLGAGLVVKSLVQTGKEVESLKVRFKFLFGTVKEGNKAFDNLAKFASKVPFSLEEISMASGNLAVVAKDAEDLTRILEITGNVAAVTGLDFQTTASQIQRAFSGGIAAADIFREKGVRSLLGFQQGAKVSIEQTVQAFESAFSGNGRFAQATNDLANTFEGTVSMLGDKLFKFKTDINQRFFTALKNAVGDLNKFFESNAKVLESVANTIGSLLATAVVKLSNGIVFLKDNVNLLLTGFAGIVALKVTSVFMGIAKSIGIMSIAMRGFNAATKANIIFASIAAFAASFAFLNTQLKKFKGNIDDLSDANKKQLHTTKGLEKELARLRDEYSKLDVSKKKNKRKAGDLRVEIKKLEDQLSALIKTEKTYHNEVRATIREQARMNSVYAVGTQEIKSLREQLGEKLIKGLDGAEKALVKFSDGVAEAIVKGKSFGQTLKVLAQDILVFVISQILQTVIAVVFLDKTLEFLKKKLEEIFGTTEKAASGFVRLSAGLGLATASQFAFNSSVKETNKSLAQQNQLSNGGGSGGIGSSLGTVVGTALGGSLGGAVGGFLGGMLGFADGGRPPINRPSIVGERGAEVFVPDQSGTIVPNDALGGSTNVTFNINTVDATGFASLLDSRRGQIINMVNSALNTKGKAALV
tara:strand:- start:1133 stop:3181 length:2049 start_codon:yes stop_codon:yes gene_type:complete